MSSETVKTAPTESKKDTLDLEIKDAQLIFRTVWDKLVEEIGEVNIKLPREIFWLNGAPGAGKGTQTRFIMEYTGLTGAPIVISSLLNSPEAQRLKDAGLMVGDREVTDLMLHELLSPERSMGCVVDGFPRTKVQVECLKLLYQKLSELRIKYLGTQHEEHFPKPIFHIIVLYVTEAVSVNRQLQRGRQIQAANRRARETGSGDVVELRKTDLDVDAARNRYRTFKEITYESLSSLREIFHYHFIDAGKTIEEVQGDIVEELRYQSSLELDQITYDLIAPIPTADSIVVHARQELVERLDRYALHDRELFESVLRLIKEKFMPIVLRHAISGHAMMSTEDSIFEDHRALAMAIDIFSERGYKAVVDIRLEEIPNRVDLATGLIETRRKRVYRFQVYYKGSVIRRGH